MNITQECFDHNARISTIIHVGGAIVDEDTLSDALDRFIEDDLWDLGYELFPVENPFAAIDDVDDMEVPYKVEAAEWLIHNRLFGFLVQVDTPVIRTESVRLNDDGSLSGYSYTWGYYKHRWFYADTFEEAAKAGIEWVKKQTESSIKNAREPAEAAGMTKPTENPFFSGERNGRDLYVLNAEDRISRVRHFDRKQCLAALALPDLQKTVSRAVERRLRQIDRGK